MPQKQVFGGHGSGGSGDEGEFGGGQASMQASVSEADELLEEIDGMLETNAEEFVLSFVQKGGQ
ncbi:MAG: ubiquitin-like protein Pup [Lawsonella sp.]